MVLGVGGLGMPLVQQLAQLGVRRFHLTDPGRVVRGNVDRLVGATREDLGLPKVIVAERLIRAVDRRAEVTVHVVQVPNADVVAQLPDASLVVGCFGKDEPRLATTEFCSAAGTPYVDLGTQIVPTVTPGTGGRAYSGQVVVASDGRGCLSCLDVLPGGSEPTPLGPAAALVAISGVVASLAAMEIMCLLTGLRAPARRLTYRSDLATVKPCRDVGRPDCSFCARWRGAG
jgi:molybdopterin/thiamine biosynthesis adenylyltransferase